MTYPNQQVAYIKIGTHARHLVIAELYERARRAPKGWSVQLHESSVIISSNDKARILKVDWYRMYTMDVRRPDGTYKSSQFKCASVDEAWNMVNQVTRSYKPTNDNYRLSRSAAAAFGHSEQKAHGRSSGFQSGASCSGPC